MKIKLARSADPILAALARGDVGALLALHHSTFGDSRMEKTAEEIAAEEAAKGKDGKAGEDGKEEKKEKLLPQSEVDRIVRERVRETKKSTADEIAKELGIPVAQAKDIIAAANARADEEKSDAQKARDAADAEKKAAADEKAAAALEKHNLVVERALIRAGLDIGEDEAKAEKRLNRALRSIEAEVGADAQAIKDAVATLKEEEPTWFGVTKEETNDDGKGKGKAPNGDPKGGPKKKDQTNETAYERGLRLARERGNHGQAYPETKTG